MKLILSVLLALFIIGCSGQAEPEDSIDSAIEENEIIEEDTEAQEVLEEEVVEEAIEEKEWEVEYKINPNLFTVEPIKEGVNEQVVLITIDDAPDQQGAKMAEILHELEVGAIFFVNGHFLKSENGVEQLKKIHELGFEIGNHTMTHPNLSKLQEEEQRKEIIELNNLIEEIIGERPRFFRAPFGVNTDVSKEEVAEEGMQWMNWSFGYDFDPKYMEAEALADITVNTPLLMKGANILMHDREFTMEALEDIVVGLRNKGYEFVHPKQIK